MRLIFEKRDLLKLAAAAVSTVADLEGWDSPHSSWTLTNGGFLPSSKFTRELAKKLRHHGYIVSEAKGRKP
ncbi:hypothetical protein LCGC14_1312420 [marine sediment metagenome]|uniref:Uncharacterized protein n=1 Tax=marine sediment metagenome TaxID=412755 RepID=A0A0F9KLT5_9ZZZZ